MLDHYPADESHALDAGEKPEHRFARRGGLRVSTRPAGSANFFLVEHGWAFVLFLLVYTLPGLFGHQPWKQDETYIIDIVRSMVDTRDVVVPTMAGEPFMEKPPLFYWVAGAFAKLLTPVLSFHDAARAATAFFILLACAALVRCGRQWRDRAFGRCAALVLLACFGMQAYGHLMLTDIALLAGIAVGFSGLPCWRRQPVRSGLVIGIGVGIGFLSKGLLAPGLFAISGLILPVCFPRWRHPAYARTILVAVAAALPFLVIWPASLYLRSPALFSDWLWLNNIGRFLGFAVPTLGAAHDEGFWTKNLWWITFPALPLALSACWRARYTIRENEMLQACIAFAGVIAGVLLLSASARGGYALPLLVPLSLLGADGVRRASPGAQGAWRRLVRIGFSAMALLIWCGWAYLVFSEPTSGTQFFRDQFAPDLDRHLHLSIVALSAFVTLAGIGLMWYPVRQAAIQTWVLGMAICWLLLACLFMPWVDQVKSYQGVFASMRTALPTDMDCMESEGLGESERAMLDYYQHVITERLERNPRAACGVLLVEGVRLQPPEAPDQRVWKILWEGARPADTREHFWLYRRASF